MEKYYYYKTKRGTESFEKINNFFKKLDDSQQAIEDIIESTGANGYYPISDPNIIYGGIESLCFDKKPKGFKEARFKRGYIPSKSNIDLNYQIKNLPVIYRDDINSILETHDRFFDIESNPEVSEIFIYPEIKRSGLVKWVESIDNPDLEEVTKEVFECDRNWSRLHQKWDDNCMLYYVQIDEDDYDENDEYHVVRAEFSFNFLGIDYSVFYDGEDYSIHGSIIAFDSFDNYLDEHEDKLKEIFASFKLYCGLSEEGVL